MEIIYRYLEFWAFEGIIKWLKYWNKNIIFHDEHGVFSSYKARASNIWSGPLSNIPFHVKILKITKCCLQIYENPHLVTLKTN